MMVSLAEDPSGEKIISRLGARDRLGQDT